MRSKRKGSSVYSASGTFIVLAMALNGIGNAKWALSEIGGRAIMRVTGAIIQNKETGACADNFYLARIF